MRLESCPFCGLQATTEEQPFGVHSCSITKQNEYGTEITVYIIGCPSCGIVTPRCNNEQAAVNIWNRRPKEVLILIARALECAEHPYNGLKLLQEAALLYREKYDA